MKDQIRSRKYRKGWPFIATIVVTFLTLGFTVYSILGPPSPERVRDRAIRALELGDYTTLCRLADREELVKLNVTPQAVSSLLGETFWRSGYPKHRSRSKQTPTPRDLSIWLYEFSGGTSGYSRVVVRVIDTPKIGWKLNLTSLLRSTCYWSAGADGGPAKYRELARKYGIRGLRKPEGDYDSIEQMEARAMDARGGGG